MTNPDFTNHLLLRDLLRTGDWLAIEVEYELFVVHRENADVFVRFGKRFEAVIDPVASQMIMSAFSRSEVKEIIAFARDVIRASVLLCAWKREDRLKGNGE